MSAPRRLFLPIAVLATAGIAVSSVSLYHHFGTEKSSYCDFGQSFNCDMVNRSIYSSIMGIPVALIGVLGYLAMLALASLGRNRPDAPALLFGASLVGLAFALYLTYIEAFVLAVWCILCLSSLALIFAISCLSMLSMRSAKRAG
jgi:uncharacterized membrane protein